MLRALLFSQLLVSIALFQEVQEYIVTIENGGHHAGEMASIKSQLQVYDVSIQQEIVIGNLSFLVIKMSPQSSLQIKALQGVLNVEANAKVKAFSETLNLRNNSIYSQSNDTNDNTRFEDKSMMKNFMGFATTDIKRLTQMIEKQDFCYEENTKDTVWGLTRIVQR